MNFLVSTFMQKKEKKIFVCWHFFKLHSFWLFFCREHCLHSIKNMKAIEQLMLSNKRSTKWPTTWHQPSLHLKWPSVIQQQSRHAFMLSQECESIFSPVQPWTVQSPEGTWVWRPAGWRVRDTPGAWQEERDCGVINGCACHTGVYAWFLGVEDGGVINISLYDVWNWPNLRKDFT